jgi:hypothetical protein
MTEKTGPDWAAVQEDYVNGNGTLSDIVERHGVSREAIGRRRRAEKWPARRPHACVVQRRVVIGRLLQVLDRQVAILEARLTDDQAVQPDAIRLVEILTKTFEKLIALDNTEKQARGQRDRPEPEMAVLRKKLADRIMKLGT